MTLPKEQATTVGLGDMPPELVLEIAPYMRQSDKYHLMLTCRGMHSIIQDVLYDEDIKTGQLCALRAGCARGYIDLIEAVLNRGAPVDCVFGRHTRRKTSTAEDVLYERDLATTPLTTAVACRQLEAVKFLLRRGARANYAALRPDSGNVFDALPVKFQRPPASFQTFHPIQWAVNPRVSGTNAAQRKQSKKLTEEIMHALISHKADVNAIPPNLEQFLIRTPFPLTLAIANKDVPSSVVRMLLDAGSRGFGAAADPTNGPFAYFIRAEFGSDWDNRRKSLDVVDEEKIQLLLSRATPSDLGRMRIFEFNELLRSPPTPAMLRVTRIFLSHNTQFFDKPWSHDVLPPLAVSVKAFMIAVNQVEPSQNLHCDWSLESIRGGYRDLFSLLLEFGAPLNPSEPQRPNRHPDTALTVLCCRRCLKEDVIEEFVEFFLSKGASPTHKDSLGNSPLVYALQAFCVRTARLLLSKAPITDFSQSPQQNPSREHVATSFLYKLCTLPEPKVTNGKQARADCAELMINCGAILNVLNDHSRSPLTYACRTGDVNLVRCLLAHGANPNHDPVPGTSLQLTVGLYTNSNFTTHPNRPDDESMIKIVNLLLSFGAEVPMPSDWKPGFNINVAIRGGCPQRIVDLLWAKNRALVEYIGPP